MSETRSGFLKLIIPASSRESFCQLSGDEVLLVCDYQRCVLSVVTALRDTRFGIRATRFGIRDPGFKISRIPFLTSRISELASRLPHRC
ncbi:hypothetical protein AYO43_02395 [Nitrospira sp. SCGC AG-212-E16]|nr:hypothetical protein AYO43_02395 [Nitrospira sp. SCGC AG-212-E16]